MNASQVTSSQWVRGLGQCVEIGGVTRAGVAFGQLVLDHPPHAQAGVAVELGGELVSVRELAGQQAKQVQIRARR